MELIDAVTGEKTQVPDTLCEVTAEEILAARTRIPFLPSGDRVVVERLKEITQVGQIIIPDQAIEKPKEGIVVALGEGKLIETEGYRLKCTVELGDRVLFGQHSGFDIELGKAKYVILREDEILGVNLIPLPVEETPAEPRKIGVEAVREALAPDAPGHAPEGIAMHDVGEKGEKA